ncbi:MAG TPA: PKD domain-containing protein [Bacteroidia bacterium]|jgi:gliding motility-associated-like protein
MTRLQTKYLLLLLLFTRMVSVHAAGVKHPGARSSVRFTENRSQWEKNILFRADLDGGAMFLEKNSFTYNFYDKETLRKNHVAKSPSPRTNDALRSHAFRVTFLNALNNPLTEGKSLSPDYSNFYIGNDKSRWAGGVPNFKEVYYKSLYRGIDLQVLGFENSLKYNFIVAPQASSADIKLFYEGQESITLVKGSLVLKTSLNEIVEQKPYAYQIINGKQVEVPCRFVLKNNILHFNFPKGYDHNKELVIDPVLVFACSSGSTADNFGMTATYDNAGNLYGGGTAFNVGYPVTLGAYDPLYSGIVASGRTDVVITKYDSSGTFLQYSTYLGGAVSTEVVSSLIVNSQDELMLFGATGSTDFPVTSTAFDTTFNGGTYMNFSANGTEYVNGTDLYLARFNSTGTSLLASTFVGGSANEGTNNSNALAFNYGDYYRGEVQVDAAGNFYIASYTYSSDFPVTAGCLQPSPGGGMDGVVFKMPPDLSAMTWSTYLGGSLDDGCYALVLDPQSNVYTTGGTNSVNFPTTPGAIGTLYNGGQSDGYVTKISNDGAAILNSTLIGTNAYDQSFLIQLDNFFNVYIIGQSLGSMPVSAGVYSNPNSKQFIWKMNSTLTSTLFTTIFGNGNGQVNISPAAFLVDVCGNIYVCGWGGNILLGTPTTNMPLTPGAFQPATDGFNFYLFVLAPDATSLLYGTYFGGGQTQEHVDGGTSRFDKKGIVYQAVCAGCGGNDDFPVTPGSWPYGSPTYTPLTPGVPSSGINKSFNCNMGVFKFDFQTAGVSADANIFPNDTICAGDSVHFNNASANALNYLWDFGDGSPISTQSSPTHQYPLPGTYDVRLIAIDSTGCLFADTSDLTVVVAPYPLVSLGNDTILCESVNLLLDAGSQPGIGYYWSSGDSTQTITATSPGEFWVEVSNNHCSTADTLQIAEIILEPFLGNDTSLCDGQTLQLNVFEPGLSYLWSTGAVTPSITVTTAGQYWVQVTLGPCTRSDTIIVNYIPYPVITLPASTIICPDDSLVLNGGIPATAYLWSTADTTQNIIVSESGTYSVTASNFQCSTTAATNTYELVFPVLGPDTNLCAGQTITLDISYPGASYLWSTGAVTNSISVSAAGEYWVSLSFAGCTRNDTISIGYIDYPVISLIPAITICPGDSALLQPGGSAEEYIWSTGDTLEDIYASSTGNYIVTASNQHCSSTASTVLFEVYFIPLVPDTTLCAGQAITLDATTPGATYLWSTGASSPVINVSTAGQYWVTAVVGFCQNKDTVNISYVPYPVVNLPSSIDLCPQTSVTLDAGNTALAYSWSTGDQTQTITTSAGGPHIVVASNMHCSVSDTTLINAIPPVAWTSSTTLCNVERYTLESGVQASSYLWSTGEITPSIEVLEAGVYWVVANSSGCYVSDTINIEGGLGNGVLWFPNSFTPNENGLNDIFTGKGADITYFDLMIFNRWGELIYETEKQNEGWDGFYKGSLTKPDVYVWKVKYKTKCSGDEIKSKIGHVTLIQ